MTVPTDLPSSGVGPGNEAGGDGPWRGPALRRPVQHRVPWRSIWNFVQLQVGWFACVLGAAEGLYWLGPAVVAVLLAQHLYASADRRREVEVMAVLAVFGSAMDSVQSGLGLLSFEGATSPWICPPWIAALWLHFGSQRETMLRLAFRYPALAALFGAVGGPLAYWAGVRLGAASFHSSHPEWSVVSLALVWSLAMPAAGWLAWRTAGWPIRAERAAA